MPITIQGVIGAPSTPYVDSAIAVNMRQGRMGELIVNQFKGKYAEANARGILFHACTPIAGVTLPIITSSTQTYAIWNPPNSNRVAEMVCIELGYLSAAEVPGNLAISIIPQQVLAATGVLIGATTATSAAPISGQYGGTGPTPQCKLLSSITLGGTITMTRTLGVSYETAVATSTNAAFYQAYQFDGKDALYPGQAMYVGGSVAAFAGVCIVNTTFIEWPFGV